MRRTNFKRGKLLKLRGHLILGESLCNLSTKIISIVCPGKGERLEGGRERRGGRLKMRRKVEALVGRGLIKVRVEMGWWRI